MMNHMKKSLDVETRGSPSTIFSNLKKRKVIAKCFILVCNKKSGETVAFWELHLVMLLYCEVILCIPK